MPAFFLGMACVFEAGAPEGEGRVGIDNLPEEELSEATPVDPSEPVEEEADAEPPSGTSTSDPDDGADDGGESDEAPDDLEPRPIVAELDLGDGVTMRFIAADEARIGIAFGGPMDADFDFIGEVIATSSSPLELYEALAPGDAAAPVELAELSDAVVSLGNWSGCHAQEKSSSPSVASSGNVEPLEHPATPTTDITAQPNVQATSCGNLNAWGDVLPANAGNCTTWNRDIGEDTNWWYDDITAFAAHVGAYEGGVYWHVQHRNCNVSGCDWHLDHDMLVPEGYHYYYYTTDNNDDFRAESIADSQNNGGSHYHDVARIHDWWHRVVIGSYGQQAHGITYSSSSLYCTETPYEGVDPSNIATGASWDGNNQVSC